MRLSDFIGQEEAKLGLALNAVDPRCGGLLLLGCRGTGKSTLARLYRGILPPETPFVELPLNVTEDSLLGGVDLERTIATGRRTFQPGILSRADGGVVFVDDINLLSPELMPLLMEPQERGMELIEREGVSRQRECRFIILATMNPEEGELSPHVMDRFGLCALMEELTKNSDRRAVMRAANDSPGSPIEPDRTVADRIARARELLPHVRFPAGTVDYIGSKAEENPASGHRGELFLYYAARACASLDNVLRVDTVHVDRVTGLVYTHRRLRFEKEEQNPVEHPRPRDQKDNPREQDKGEDCGEENISEKPEPGTDQEERKGEQETDAVPRESSEREEILPVGEPFPIRRLAFRKDRLKRRATGRRTKTRVKGRSGRYVKSLLRSTEKDIAVDATLRACAPFQTVRGRRERLVIEHEDLRFRRRERKMGHLVLFVVDGSGSMGAQRRMMAAKGAVQSLLLDCYRKRDRVAMIVFRKERAELVLPPTPGVQLAARKLAVLPTGGRTPLSAGLLEAYRLLRRISLQRPETRNLVVLVTDGRANRFVSALPPENEIEGLTRSLVELPHSDFIVVDTENKKNMLRTDLALTLARKLGAAYYTTEALHGDTLSEIVSGWRK